MPITDKIMCIIISISYITIFRKIPIFISLRIHHLFVGIIMKLIMLCGILHGLLCEFIKSQKKKIIVVPIHSENIRKNSSKYFWYKSLTHCQYYNYFFYFFAHFGVCFAFIYFLIDIYIHKKLCEAIVILQICI